MVIKMARCYNLPIYMADTLIVRNKNALIELLKGGAKFQKITLVNNLKRDDLTQKIVQIAISRQIPVQNEPLGKMAKRRGGDSHEVIAGYLIPDNHTTLSKLLDDLSANRKLPFFLLVNRVDFDNNIGIIARTAFAAGVNGLIFQGDEDRFLNEETLHYSVGSIARIPLVKMNIFAAIKELKKCGVITYSLEMDGQNVYKENLTGPIAFVLGSERNGVSSEVSQKCDKVISIPMQKGIDSLNVGVSVGIVLYEKVRQQHGIIE